MNEDYMGEYLKLAAEYKANQSKEESIKALKQTGNFDLATEYKANEYNKTSQKTIAKIYNLINTLEKNENNKLVLVYLYELLAYHKKAYDLYLKIYNENNKKQKRKLLVMKQMSATHGDDIAIKLEENNLVKKLVKKFEITIERKETIYYRADDYLEKDNIIEDLLHLYAGKITHEYEFNCFSEYINLKGATIDEITAFENDLNIVLPKDVKEYYKLKNGSGNFQLVQLNSNGRWNRFYMLPLEVIGYIKKKLFGYGKYLQYDIDKFIPFGVAQAGGNWRMHGVYLLLDPSTIVTEGKGQIACYIFDDHASLEYIVPTFSALLENTKYNLENGAYSAMRQWSLGRWYERIGVESKYGYQ
jgi:hypothetical protein